MPRFTDKVNNNLIERLHGTVRERDKVMRGLDNEESARRLIENFKIYYNFLRTHMELYGKTPAEVAGINLGLEGNRWLELIRKSVNR